MIHVFLPAYNEEIALPRVVDKFARLFRTLDQPYRIVVLDDGSSDKTFDTATQLLKRYTMAILRHERNLGLGLAMRDGLLYVAEHSDDNDLVVTMDCDDTHDPVYVSDALKKIQEDNDVVILSRYQKGGGQTGLSFFKRLTSRCAGLFLKFFFPIKGVKEYSCSYRVFRAGVLKKTVAVFGSDFIRLTHLGFAAAPELLIKFRMIGCKIAEVPFVLRYEQKPTPSKIKPLKTIIGYFALVGCFWGRKIKA